MKTFLQKNCLFALLLISANSFAQYSLNHSVIPGEYAPASVSNNKSVNGVFFTESQYKKSASTTSEYILNTPAGNDLSLSEKGFPSKEFVVQVDNEGVYYFLVNIMPANVVNSETKNSRLQKINVLVNGKTAGELNVTKSQWELVTLKESDKIRLDRGKNVILFQSTDESYYPEIDCIQITEDRQKLVTENMTYDNYVKSLDPNNRINLKSAFTSDYGNTVAPTDINTPGANYKHKAQVPVVYTYYRKLPLPAGPVEFKTGPIDGDDYRSVNTVMYLFKENDPHNNSWFNDDYDSRFGYHSRIQTNVSAGDYYLVIRSFNNVNASSPIGREGLVNVYHNGGLLNEKVPVSGYIMNASSPYTGTLNYFTAYSTGIPKIWFLDGNKMLYFSNEYSYYPPADFYWIDDTRLKINHNRVNSNINIMISAVGAMGFYFGNSDVYAGVPDAESKYLNLFPNLKSGDAMRSANDNYRYNSAAWAGGLTGYSVWAGQWGSPYVWASWDNYFGNNPQRYSGAKNYSRNGYGNAVIAMYSTNGTVSGTTHFAVSRNANNQMHGYNWESKINTWGRIFHPLNSLSGGSYGNVFAYYYDETNPYYTRSSTINEEAFTLDNSVRSGLTVIEDVQLDQKEKLLISSTSFPDKTYSQLTTLFEKWNSRIHSEEYLLENNPYNFLNNQEGRDLIGYAGNNLRESILFFTGELFRDNVTDDSPIKGIIPVLFCEITKDRYGNIMEDIKSDWLSESYTNEGAYKFPSPDVFAKKYAKAILNNEYLNKTSLKSSDNTTNNNIMEGFDNNEQLFSVMPNPVSSESFVKVTLSSDATVSLKIVGLNGAVAESMLTNKKLSSGVHSFPINANRLSPGLSVCILEIDGRPYSRKILKK